MSKVKPPPITFTETILEYPQLLHICGEIKTVHALIKAYAGAEFRDAFLFCEPCPKCCKKFTI